MHYIYLQTCDQNVTTYLQNFYQTVTRCLCMQQLTASQDRPKLSAAGRVFMQSQKLMQLYWSKPKHLTHLFKKLGHRLHPQQLQPQPLA